MTYSELKTLFETLEIDEKNCEYFLNNFDPSNQEFMEELEDFLSEKLDEVNEQLEQVEGLLTEQEDKIADLIQQRPGANE